MEIALARPAMSLGVSAEKFGPRLQPHLTAFRTCMKLASELIETRGDPKPLDSHIEDLDDMLDALPSTDILFHHITALSTASAAFGCVLTENPPEQLAMIVAEAKPSITALRSMNDSSHVQFGTAVESVLESLTAWIGANLKTGITSTNGASAVAAAQESVSSLSNTPPKADAMHTAPHLVDYRTAISEGAVKDFLDAADAIGGCVSEQAAPAAQALRDIYSFLVRASELSTAPAETEKQTMIADIVKHMTKAAEISGDCPSSDPLFNHVKAVEEALGMVSWIVANEKPMTFVTDAEGSSAFYLNKILTATKKQGAASTHKIFVDSVKALFPAMKSYIKEHHTMGVRYGIGVEGKSSCSNMVNQVSAADDDTDGENYVTIFQKLLTGPLAVFLDASKAIGGDVEEQGLAFAAAWEAEAEFLAKAVNMPKPKPEDIQELVAPIAAKMGEVGAVVEKVDPRGPLAQHCNAVGESVAALGWVAVEEKATAYVGDMAGAGQFFVDKVKMGAKKTSNPDLHRTWAKSLENLFAELKAYVKEHHTQSLVWNPPKVARAVKRSPASSANGADEAESDYVTKFKELITGPVQTFVNASNALGGEVQEQAAAFASAWEAEGEFLAKAICTPKPDDIQDLLAPIAARMGEVGAVVEKVDPRGPFAQHCNAVGESVAALGWVAVDEKATAFVGDMTGAGQFFLDKVKMDAKKTDNPDAHRTWAKALETVYSELKAYVKEYHTQKLVWNPQKGIRAKSRAPATGSLAEDTAGSDYVLAFKELLLGPLATFLDASKVLGGPVEEQALAFAAAWEAEAAFLKKAYSTPKPSDFQDLLAPIAANMEEVSAVAQRVDPRGQFAQHCNAVGESVAALGWVAVDEKATAFVGDMSGAGQFFLDKVKMDAKKTDNPEAHRTWAKGLEALYAALKAYVKEYHTQRLVWNPPKSAGGASPAGAVSAAASASSATDYVSAFKAIIAGPLAAFMKASRDLGGEVEEQASHLADAWEAEAAFLSKAIRVPKPDDIQDMLKPIATKMGDVTAIVDKVGPRGSFSQHCNAVGESVSALGWVAVDEKATAYVGDMAGAGQFFVDKVKMDAKKTTNAEAHRTWAKSLESLLAELKAYVKDYHTQKLVWNML